MKISHEAFKNYILDIQQDGAVAIDEQDAGEHCRECSDCSAWLGAMDREQQDTIDSRLDTLLATKYPLIPRDSFPSRPTRLLEENEAGHPAEHLLRPKPTVAYFSDSDEELRAFETAFGNCFRVILSRKSDQFVESLSNRSHVDLILIDLYFPFPAAAGQTLPSGAELGSMLRPVRAAEIAIEKSSSSGELLAAASALRREAEIFVQRATVAAGYGAEVGIDACRKLRIKHPDVPVVFLARELSREDADRCIKAGASAAVRVPSPRFVTRESLELGVIARLGWAEHFDEFRHRFEQLMDEDVTLRAISNIEELVSRLPSIHARSLRSFLIEARRCWLEGAHADAEYKIAHFEAAIADFAPMLGLQELVAAVVGSISARAAHTA